MRQNELFRKILLALAWLLILKYLLILAKIKNYTKNEALNELNCPMVVIKCSEAFKLAN
jgi:hypothetical protein